MIVPSVFERDTESEVRTFGLNGPAAEVQLRPVVLIPTPRQGSAMSASQICSCFQANAIATCALRTEEPTSRRQVSTKGAADQLDEGAPPFSLCNALRGYPRGVCSIATRVTPKSRERHDMGVQLWKATSVVAADATLAI